MWLAFSTPSRALVLVAAPPCLMLGQENGSGAEANAGGLKRKRSLGSFTDLTGAGAFVPVRGPLGSKPPSTRTSPAPMGEMPRGPDAAGRPVRRVKTVMKIDVEGHGCQVVNSMRGLLSQILDVRFMVMEWAFFEKAGIFREWKNKLPLMLKLVPRNLILSS